MYSFNRRLRFHDICLLLCPFRCGIFSGWRWAGVSPRHRPTVSQTFSSP
jgi:hypothetical protein